MDDCLALSSHIAKQTEAIPLMSDTHEASTATMNVQTLPMARAYQPGVI
jgi:hypothetical protein